MAKSKPIGVRFDLKKLEMIQKEQNLTSMQSVLDYLMDFYLAHSQSDKIIAELDKIKANTNVFFIFIYFAAKLLIISNFQISK